MAFLALLPFLYRGLSRLQIHGKHRLAELVFHLDTIGLRHCKFFLLRQTQRIQLPHGVNAQALRFSPLMERLVSKIRIPKPRYQSLSLQSHLMAS